MEGTSAFGRAVSLWLANKALLDNGRNTKQGTLPTGQGAISTSENSKFVIKYLSTQSLYQIKYISL
jgi:hypothetical protein